MNISICGIDCDKCNYKTENKCEGCQNVEGKPFWCREGDCCDVYACCAKKQLLHCGFCDDFPCEELKGMVEDENDNRIELLAELMKKQSVVQSRCGLMCNECDYKESCGCGGCIETNGNPFHGECLVAKCCQDKGYNHCGECDNLPGECSDPNCKRIDSNGFFECGGCADTSCDKLYPYSYKDPNHGDKPKGARVGVLRYWAKNKKN